MTSNPFLTTKRKSYLVLKYIFGQANKQFLIAGNWVYLCLVLKNYPWINSHTLRMLT